jgi:alkylhydroperoxidase family enzyme
VVHHGESFRQLTATQHDDAEALRQLAIVRSGDPTSSDLTAADKAILVFTDRVTREPWTCETVHLQPMRDAGLDDRAIYDVTAICGFFAFINRMADALGVELEPDYAEKYGHNFGDPLPKPVETAPSFHDEPHKQ